MQKDPNTEGVYGTGQAVDEFLKNENANIPKEGSLNPIPPQYMNRGKVAVEGAVESYGQLARYLEKSPKVLSFITIGALVCSFCNAGLSVLLCFGSMSQFLCNTLCMMVTSASIVGEWLVLFPWAYPGIRKFMLRWIRFMNTTTGRGFMQLLVVALVCSEGFTSQSFTAWLIIVLPLLFVASLNLTWGFIVLWRINQVLNRLQKEGSMSFQSALSVAQSTNAISLRLEGFRVEALNIGAFITPDDAISVFKNLAFDITEDDCAELRRCVQDYKGKAELGTMMVGDYADWYFQNVAGRMIAGCVTLDSENPSAEPDKQKSTAQVVNGKAAQVMNMIYETIVESSSPPTPRESYDVEKGIQD